MRRGNSVKWLEDFGRIRLSKSFLMRDFLFSDIAAIHGLANIPEDPDLAIAAGTRLCGELQEPLQERFGRIAIRSAFRSSGVNGFGNRHGLNCASNERNAAAHIWDLRDSEGRMGATACIVIPAFFDAFRHEGDEAWRQMAWWIHDHLPCHSQEWFPVSRLWSFNLGWREDPERVIRAHSGPERLLTVGGPRGEGNSRRHLWAGIDERLPQ